MPIQDVVVEAPVATSTPVEIESGKTDFGTSVPNGFPTDIPIEEGAQVEESYGYDDAGQKQLTLVFLSNKTVEQNFILYKDFLTKQKWNISNEYEGEKVSSLYATKDDLYYSNDINVTLGENLTDASTKSRISISITESQFIIENYVNESE